MFAQAQRGPREVARAPMRIVASRPRPAGGPTAAGFGSPGSPSVADRIEARPDRAVAGQQAAPSPAAGPRRDTAIVGHRLAGGYMAVHSPGQPCGLCDGAAPLPPRPVRAGLGGPAGLGRILRRNPVHPAGPPLGSAR